MVVMMLVLFLVFLFLGVPVVFSMAFPTVLYFLFNGSGMPIQFLSHTVTNPLMNYVLIALPAFLF